MNSLTRQMSSEHKNSNTWKSHLPVHNVYTRLVKLKMEILLTLHRISFDASYENLVVEQDAVDP